MTREDIYNCVFTSVKKLVVSTITGLFWAAVTYIIFQDIHDDKMLYLITMWSGVLAFVVKL
jgi:hypothetical protein